MRINLILTFLVLSTGSVFCQIDSEVYSKVIDQYILKLRPPNIDNSSSTTLTVREIPIYMNSLGPEDFARFKQKCKQLEERTFIDFIEKNPSALKIDMFNIPGYDVVLLKNDTMILWYQSLRR